MNIERTALYLSGRYSPYYQPEFDRLELIELIRREVDVSDLFLIIDSADFHFYALNLLNRKSKNIRKLIVDLKIPYEVTGVKLTTSEILIRSFKKI